MSNNTMKIGIFIVCILVLGLWAVLGWIGALHMVVCK